MVQGKGSTSSISVPELKSFLDSTAALKALADKILAEKKAGGKDRRVACSPPTWPDPFLFLSLRTLVNRKHSSRQHTGTHTHTLATCMRENSG
jgi:hypothetical protein